MIKIIEKSVIGKRNEAECEDGIIVNDNFVAVIDGSTSKTPNRVNDAMSNGKYCTELVKQYISNMPEYTDLPSFCEGITQYIHSTYKAFNIDIKRLECHPEERLTASAAIYSRHFRQIWLVGDCQCIADGLYHDNSKPQEKVWADKRSSFLLQAMKQGLTVEEVQSNDPGRKHILQDLTESCKRQNIDYAVIDGFSIPFEKVKVTEVANSNESIILASDGYPFLKSTLAESESALEALLRDDPLCIHDFKATKGLVKGNKSFDDRSYIRFVDFTA